MQATRSNASSLPVDREPTGYRPVSTLAVAALGLGVLSALVLVSPFFFVVPLVAVAVAVAALADVDRDGAPKAGRLAAIAGLALATGFGAQAITSGVVARSLAAGRATAAAEIFVRAVREGRRADAESMCGPEAREQVARLAACIGEGPSTRARAGDEPGTWVVEIAPAGRRGCTARLVLAPAVGVQQGRSFERWLVTSCTVEDAIVMPSGT
ncbi:MAG: hypothetical protein WCR51_10645 [Planctomycetia bacterium]